MKAKNFRKIPVLKILTSANVKYLPKDFAERRQATLKGRPYRVICNLFCCLREGPYVVGNNNITIY